MPNDQQNNSNTYATLWQEFLVNCATFAELSARIQEEIPEELRSIFWKILLQCDTCLRCLRNEARERSALLGSRGIKSGATTDAVLVVLKKKIYVLEKIISSLKHGKMSDAEKIFKRSASVLVFDPWSLKQKFSEAYHVFLADGFLKAIKFLFSSPPSRSTLVTKRLVPNMRVLIGELTSRGSSQSTTLPYRGDSHEQIAKKLHSASANINNPSHGNSSAISPAITTPVVTAEMQKKYEELMQSYKNYFAYLCEQKEEKAGMARKVQQSDLNQAAEVKTDILIINRKIQLMREMIDQLHGEKEQIPIRLLHAQEMFIEKRSDFIFRDNGTFDEQKFIDYCDQQFDRLNRSKAMGCFWQSIAGQRKLQDQCEDSLKHR